ncbi:hypothetical protein DY052_05825 [Apilactobacillus timberlakei]|nr:hypothetical protein DY052_05825 [Apilactobacillus timberlakei]
MNLLNIKDMNLNEPKKHELINIINLCNEYFRDQWEMYRKAFITNNKYNRKFNNQSIFSHLKDTIRQGVNEKNISSHYASDYLYEVLPDMFDLDNLANCSYNSGIPYEMKPSFILMNTFDNKKDISDEEILNQAHKYFFQNYNEAIQKLVYGYFAGICDLIPFKLVAGLNKDITWEQPEKKIFEFLNNQWHKFSPFEEFNHFVEKKNAIEEQKRKVAYVKNMKSHLYRLKRLPKDIKKHTNGIKFQIHKATCFDEEYEYNWFNNRDKSSFANEFANGLIFHLYKHYNLNCFKNYQTINFLKQENISDDPNNDIESIKVYKNGCFMIKFNNNWCKTHDNLNRLIEDLNKISPLAE